MPSPHPGDTVLTELDHARLRALIRLSTSALAVPAAVHELADAADLVPSREVQPDVITMYTQITLEHPQAGLRKLAVCWPEHAEPEAGFVSVLSPLGAALLGRRLGDEVRWQTPDGREQQARIAAVLFQPEATGDYVT